MDAPQRLRVALARERDGEDDRLIGEKPGGAIDWMRVAPFAGEVSACSNYEAGLRLVQPKQAFEMKIAAIHHVDRAGLGIK